MRKISSLLSLLFSIYLLFNLGTAIAHALTSCATNLIDQETNQGIFVPPPGTLVDCSSAKATCSYVDAKDNNQTNCYDMSAFSAPTSAPTPSTTEPCPGNLCNIGLGIKVPTNPSAVITKFFAVLLSVSGGIALLIIMFSGYNIMSSRGNPEKFEGARETLIAAIIGLFFIIFSLVALQVIGYDLLRIPEFKP